MASVNNSYNVASDMDSDAGSSDDEITIVKELHVTLENHRCDLCCEGEFLIERLLKFGGLINKKYKFVCDKCDSNFQHQSLLIRHSSRCTGPIISRRDNKAPNTPLICSICSNSFKSQRGLTKHMNMQHSGMTYTCEVCKENFSRFQQFRNHCAQHDRKRKQYVCTTCDESFHYRGSLRNHELRHRL